jgi:signal peptidase
MDLRSVGARVAKVAVLGVLLALVGAFAVYAVPELVGAEHSFVVLSSSMTPAMAPGDVVIVDDADPATIREGDVITFTRSEEPAPTTHRVIDVERREGRLAFETKGDAVPEPDQNPVPASNVVGTVALTVPYIGHVVLFAETTPGYVFLVGVPMVLLVATEVWSLAKRYRRESAAEATAESESNAGSAVDAEPDSDGDADESSSGADAQADPDGGDAGHDDATATVAVHPSDLTATSLVLAFVVPYAIYVAVSLPTPVTITVAFASGFSLVAVGGLWLVERLSAHGPPETGGEPAPDSVTDGGASGEVE